MRVTQVLYSGLGGHGGCWRSLIEAENSTWNHSAIFYGIEPCLEEYQELCQIHDIPYLAALKSGRFDWGNWVEIWRFLKQQSPDIVLCHQSSLVPLVILYCWFYAKDWVYVEHQTPKLRVLSHWFASYWAQVAASGVVFLTQEAKEMILRALPFIPRKTYSDVIANGVDINFFHPDEAKTIAEENYFRLGMAARVVPIRDQASVIRCCLALRRLGYDCQVTLAGEGPELTALRRLIEKEQAEKWVSLEGHLVYEKMADWYRSLDIYLHLTYGETLSMSLLQAMASGLPVVASDIPGVRNLVVPEAGGEVVPNDDLQAQIKVLEALLNSQQERLARGEKAREKAKGCYSQEAMYSSYNEFFQTIL